MTRGQRIAAWGTTAAVAGTGLAYGWMAWLLEPTDPLDLVNHPWQPAMLALHVLAAPVWLVVLGALWAAHVLPKLRSGAPARRRSGLVLVALGAVMAASGYLLQVAVDDAWRSLWRWTHVGSSLLWLVAFAGHVVVRVHSAVQRGWPSASRSCATAASSSASSAACSRSSPIANGLGPVAMPVDVSPPRPSRVVTSSHTR